MTQDLYVIDHRKAVAADAKRLNVNGAVSTVYEPGVWGGYRHQQAGR